MPVIALSNRPSLPVAGARYALSIVTRRFQPSWPIEHETFDVSAVYTLYEDECDEHPSCKAVYICRAESPSRVGEPIVVT